MSEMKKTEELIQAMNTMYTNDTEDTEEIKEIINILIVEDNPIQCQSLQKNISELSCSPNVFTATNLTDAIKILRQSLIIPNPFHLFLLDIHLSEDETKYEGFQLAKLIRSYAFYQMTPMFFLTSNRKQVEFALCNFHCYNYIKKPYNMNNVARQIEHVLQASNLKLPDTYIVLKDTHRIAHKVMKDCILYLVSNGHAIDIVCVNDKVTTRDFNLTTLLNLLGNNFYRCHKKYIVNINMIDNFDYTCCKAELGDHVIPVGRTYKEELMENIPFS